MLTTIRYCMDPQGNDVLVGAEGGSSEEHGHSHGGSEGESSGGSGEVNCHFHAGVE